MRSLHPPEPGIDWIKYILIVSLDAAGNGMNRIVGIAGGVNVAVAVGVSVIAGVEVNVGSSVGVSVGGKGVKVGVSVGSGVAVLVGGAEVSVGGTGVLVGNAGSADAHAARICTASRTVNKCNIFFFIICQFYHQITASQSRWLKTKLGFQCAQRTEIPNF